MSVYIISVFRVFVHAALVCQTDKLFWAQTVYISMFEEGSLFATIVFNLWFFRFFITPF